MTEAAMRREELARYLGSVLGGVVEVRALRPLGIDQPAYAAKRSEVLLTGDLKAFGYGRPIQSGGVGR